ncbi:hypothetical protein [Bacillus changyiensis]|uniref:hypothetical protein n=1 Tax=Bacillus changyiensis TaxID=3004103 RepID=UPI0022E96074|nr:hypothetical protein [Bacillus changyiensis]MDA1476197.1 hypothetical protein [Bacillus changyiensis]
MNTINKGVANRKLQKTVVSMLSVSALAFSLSTSVSAEVSTHSKPFKQAPDIHVKGIETVGEWNKTISTTGGEITLDTVQYKFSTVLSDHWLKKHKEQRQGFGIKYGKK